MSKLSGLSKITSLRNNIGKKLHLRKSKNQSKERYLLSILSVNVVSPLGRRSSFCKKTKRQPCQDLKVSIFFTVYNPIDILY